MDAGRPLRSRRTLAGALAGLVSVAGLLWLVACSSLPTIVPDLARESGRPPVPLEGARGPLSAAQSKAILDGLASRGPATDIFERAPCHRRSHRRQPADHRQRGVVAAGRPGHVPGDVRGHPPARDHIHLETYILDDDEVGQRFARVLIDKQRQGVQVNLIPYSVGTIGTPQAFFDQMKAMFDKDLAASDPIKLEE